MSTSTVQLRRIFFSNSFKHLFTVKLFTQFMCKKLSLSLSLSMCSHSWSLFLFYHVDYYWIWNSLICPVFLIATSKYVGLNDKGERTLNLTLGTSATLSLLILHYRLISSISSSFYTLLNVCFLPRFCYHKKKKSVYGSFAPGWQLLFQH